MSSSYIGANSDPEKSGHFAPEATGRALTEAQSRSSPYYCLLPAESNNCFPMAFDPAGSYLHPGRGRQRGCVPPKAPGPGSPPADTCPPFPPCTAPLYCPSPRALSCRRDNLANELVRLSPATRPGHPSAHLGNFTERLGWLLPLRRLSLQEA